MKYFVIFLVSITTLVNHACNSESSEAEKPQGPSTEDLIEQPNISNNPDSILAIINDKLVESPNDASLYQERAYHLFHTFKARKQDTTDKDIIEEPIRDIKHAIELDPNNPDYYFSKGYFFHAALMLDEAETAFKQAIEIDPKHQESYYFLAKIYLVLAHPSDRDKFNYDKAREMLNESLKINENHVESYFLRGLIYKELGDSGAALNSFKTVTDINPKHYNAFMQQGMLYASKGNPKAEVVFKQAIEIKPNSTEAHFALARFQQTTGKFEKAEQNYLKTVEIDSMYSIAYLNLGYMYMTNDTAYTKALEYLHKAVYFNPGSYLAMTYYNIALVHELKGDKERAKTYYKQTLEVDNEYIDAAKALDRLERGGS